MKNSVWEERRSGKSLNRKDDPRTPFERDRARVIHLPPSEDCSLKPRFWELVRVIFTEQG